MPVVESTFPMAPLSKIALSSGKMLTALVAILTGPVILAVIVVAIVKNDLVLWVAVSGMVCVLGSAIGFLVAIERASRRMADVRFEVGAAGLKIVSKLYPREFPIATLSVEGARLIDLHKEWGHKPGISATGPLGINLMGSCIGAYRLVNGQRALVYLAFPAPKPAVWVPTTSGLPLLLSPDDPAGFVEALRAAK